MLVEKRGRDLLLAGGTLTVGAVGWTTARSCRPTVGCRCAATSFITIGCANVAIGLALAGVLALVPTLPYWLIAVAWIFSGLGMGFADGEHLVGHHHALQRGRQGRNGSSLNLGDALGSSVLSASPARCSGRCTRAATCR